MTRYFSTSDLSFADERAPVFIAAGRKVEYSAGLPVLFGAGYDGTTSFRPGTRFGPDAIRLVSDGLETYSPVQDKDLEDYAVLDAGNLDLPFGAPGPAVARVEAATRELLEHALRPVMLGGEHSLTAGAVQAALKFFPDLCMIQFDAHADLRHEYLGEANSHACAMRRCLDAISAAQSDPKMVPGTISNAPDTLESASRLLQVGIRSGTREEFQEMRATDRLVAPQADQLAERARAFAGRPVYLSIDLDIFDPALLPGTGTPEPGGIDWATFQSLLSAISSLNIVACDIMELAPSLDPTSVSSLLAAKVLREVLLSVL